ncbi:hypothetical protein C8R43DRAFT_209855 [Mycena crocata]|nr:hypothetical protein C8R43DRAFT_209855 [Mycena crocata]
MDANFTFPARPQAVPRPAPAQPQAEPVQRESNALRASVLDAALQLGLGANGTVANWMFNNTLEEEEEEVDEDAVGRGPLSATSDEFASYSTPPTSTSSHSETFHPNVASPLYSPAADAPASLQVHFPPMATIVSTPAPSSSNKLRKQRRDGGYESDGYVSDGGKKARTRTKSKTTKEATTNPVFPISEPMELIPLTKEERKRKKKATKASKDHDAPAETDVEDVKPTKSKSPPKPKKTKKPSHDGAAGYETDDGYVSSSGKPKKGRSRFFSLRKKSDSTSEPAVVEPVPPMPEREVFSLPIASRFATTLGGDNAAPSMAPNRSATPLLPPSRPFVSTSASGSSSASLSSSSNSLLTPGDQESFGSGSLSIRTEPRRFADEDSLRSGHTPDNSYNSTLTVTPSQEQESSRSFSPQPPNTKSKFLISYPLTRTPSPGSPHPPPPQNSRPKPVPSPISLSPYPQNASSSNSRAPSPSPSGLPGSPYVLLTPLNKTPSRAASPAPSSIVIPSTDYIVPSRSGSPLPPSPNVLAYYNNYDVPPSPPPNAPLPRVPRPPPSANRDPTPGVARLRSLSQDRTGRHLDANSPLSGRVSPSPISPSGAMSPLSAGGERGRAAPFPARPVLAGRAATGNGMGPGLAARAKVQRYRDLYAIQIPATPVGARAPPSDDEMDIRVEDWASDGEEDPEMLGVLGRFQDTREQHKRVGSALERNNSGALRPGITGRLSPAPSPSPTAEEYSDVDDDDVSKYPDDDKTAGRSTMYKFDNGSGTRETMRWSEYSTRASLLDIEKSEQARGQLVERVGVMFDLSGRERSRVPPVPKLPAAFLAAGGPGGNRF